MKKYNYNMNAFTNEDNFSYYLLGLFITDGCVYKNGKNNYACQLSSIDYDWLQSIANVIGTNLKPYQHSENYYSIRIMRNNIAKWFIEHGCLPNKTYNVELPTIKDEHFSSFMLGVMDGDGCIGCYKSCNKCCIISVGLKFLEQIQVRLKTFDIECKILNKSKNNGFVNNKPVIATTDIYHLNFSKDIVKFLKFIYSSNIDVCLPRKLAIAEKITKP